MSGGSYEYLCFKEARDIYDSIDSLEAMTERLEGLGYADDVAKETRAVLDMLQPYQNALQQRLDRLRDIWHAMEWWDSCDTSEDDFKKELEKYRVAEAKQRGEGA